MNPLIYKCDSITEKEMIILHHLVKNNLYSEPVAGTKHYNGAYMTPYDFNKIDHPLIKKYNQYIYSVINKAYVEYCYPKSDPIKSNNKKSLIINGQEFAFEIAESWGIIYNENQGVIEHNHFPYSLSCAYYLNTPNGSAPITIKDKTYNVKAGECIIFLSTDRHKVEFNNCKDRSAIVCNIKLWKI
jgi:hypothetical protein